MKLTFRIFDDEEDDAVRSYRLLVNDVPYGDQVEVNAPVIETTIDWTVPADAQPGEVFTLRLEATDSFDNTGFAIIQLTVPPGTILTGNQLIDTDHAGEDLVLANGTFTATTALNPTSLTILQGAKLETLNSQPLVITTGDLRHFLFGIDRRDGSRLWGGHDVSGSDDSEPQSAVEEATLVRAVSSERHAGETYGSVYRPQENGGGGESARMSERGGGTVRIEAETVGPCRDGGDPSERGEREISVIPTRRRRVVMDHCVGCDRRGRDRGKRRVDDPGWRRLCRRPGRRRSDRDRVRVDGCRNSGRAVGEVPRGQRLRGSPEEPGRCTCTVRIRRTGTWW